MERIIWTIRSKVSTVIAIFVLLVIRICKRYKLICSVLEVTGDTDMQQSLRFVAQASIIITTVCQISSMMILISIIDTFYDQYFRY